VIHLAEIFFAALCLVRWHEAVFILLQSGLHCSLSVLFPTTV